MLFRTCAHVGGNGGKSAKERAEAREVTLITQGKRGYINGARVYRGRSGRWEFGGGGRGGETAIWAGGRHPGRRPHEHKSTHGCLCEGLGGGDLAASIVELPPEGACNVRHGGKGRRCAWDGVRIGLCRTCLHRPSTYTFPHPAVRVHRSLAKHSVLNQASFRSTEHTAPSASSQYGDALATTPPLDLSTQRSVSD